MSRRLAPMLPVAPATLLLGACLALLSAPSPVAAQEALRYTQTTTVELGGSMGAAVALARGIPGVEEPAVHQVLIQGTRMREDRDGVTTLTDWEAGEVTIVDHEARTWRTLTLGQQIEESMEDVGTPVEGVDLGMSFRTETTGRTDTVAGLPARQVVFVLDMGATVGSTGVRTALVTELWVSDAFPTGTLAPEARAALSGGYTPESVGDMMRTLGPDLARVMEEQRDALQELEGMTVRAVAHMVMLPPEGEVDVERVLATELVEPGAEDLSDAEAAARARQRLMELFQGGPDAEPIVTMRTRTAISEVERVTPEPDAFAVPEGYAEAPDRGGRSG